MADTDWNPESYGRFASLRLRPALDLLMRVGDLPEGDICDLGCGAGAMGLILMSRYDGRRIIGVDSSKAMLEKARGTGGYDELVEDDIAQWGPENPPALIFSNAALHWLPEHGQLLPRLAGLLAPGGTLAVQVPHQNRAPSHRLWHDLAEQLFPGRFDPGSGPGVLEPVDYHRILSPLGDVALWETEFYQQLPAAGDGHPVRHFTSSTYARPVLQVLDEAETARLVERYDTAMETAYPLAADGSVLFPFRRLFFTLTVR